MHALHLLNSLPWPLDSGRRINAHHLMRCLVDRGHQVSVLLRDRPDDEALAAWPLASRVSIHVLNQRSAEHAPRRHSDRWMRYWGVEAWVPAATAEVCERLSPDYIEAIGLDTPLWLAGWSDQLRGRRLWLAGDDPSLLHRTMIRTTPGLSGKASELRRALAMWAYERRVATLVDAAVAVSPADADALRRTGGFNDVLLTPNGVDADHFAPGTFAPTNAPAEARSAVFWGRLDFPPNADAVAAFVRDVWPIVLRRCPGAKLWVVGRSPTDRVRRACAAAGVELVADVEDVRPWIARGAVTVLPMRSGAGIKNKLLEAAAMARPIAASPRAVAGLNAPADGHPWRTCEGPGAWAEALIDLWRNPSAAQRLGDAARRWVMTHHDWTSHAVAREAFAKRASDNISPGSSPAERRSALPGGGSRDVFPESLAA